MVLTCGSDTTLCSLSTCVTKPGKLPLAREARGETPLADFTGVRPGPRHLSLGAGSSGVAWAALDF